MINGPIFKRGDKVRCIEADSFERLVKHKIYTVVCESYINGIGDTVVKVNGWDNNFLAKRFVLAEKSGFAKFLELQESLK